jgi:glutathione S-transferase
VITLYGPAVAPFVEKVARGLALKGLPFQLVEPRGPEDFRKWNPETGLLPVLDVDGERIHDSTTILFWLDERFPEPPLLSPDPKAAAMQKSLEAWADETFMWHWLRWQNLKVKNGYSEGAEPADLAASVQPGSGLRARLARWLLHRSPLVGHDPLLREIENRLDDLLRMLGGRPFFYAEQPSMADLGVYGMLRTIRMGNIPGADRLLADRRTLVAYMERLEKATGS